MSNARELSELGTIVTVNGGNVGIGTSSPDGKVASQVNFGNGSASNYLAQAIGTAQGQRAGYSFRSTFEGTGDSTPRRSADIWSGFNGGAWGAEYLAFGVGNNGSSNDTQNQTSEKMRITGAGNLQFNSGYGSVATAFGCRAWVNFNGTGTVAIRASGNVSSITDRSAGTYSVNFTTAMPDANYCIVTNTCQNAAQTTGGGIADICFTGAQTTSDFYIFSYNSNTATDFEIIDAAVFR
jgi:hypothetical protein